MYVLRGMSFRLPLTFYASCSVAGLPCGAPDSEGRGEGERIKFLRGSYMEGLCVHTWPFRSGCVHAYLVVLAESQHQAL